MMGLIARMPCSAQRARLAADHSNHFASSVRTSSMTLLSTRISATLVPGQGHNFVSREFYRPFPAKVGNQLMPTVLDSFLLSDAHRVSHDVESHFGVRKQPEPFTDVLWNGDLSLRCYTHRFLLLLLILLLPKREIKAEDFQRYTRSVGTHFTAKPCLGQIPLAQYRARRYIEDPRRFFNCQTAKKSQFNDLTLTLVEFTQRLQRLVQCDDFARRFAFNGNGVVQRRRLHSASPLLVLPGSCVVDKDAAHELRGNGEEL